MFHVEHCQGPFPYTTRKRPIIYTTISDISNLFLNYFFSYLFVRNMALANEYSKGVRAKFFGRFFGFTLGNLTLIDNKVPVCYTRMDRD